MLVELESEFEKWFEECVGEKMFDDEISNLYFVIVQDKNSFHLEFCGSENFSLFDFDYRPKCGEHFFCDYSEGEEKFVEKIIFLLINLIKKNSIKNIIKNKNIYLIYFQNKIIKKIK